MTSRWAGAGQVELLQQLFGAGLCTRGLHVVEATEHLEVLSTGQALVHRGVLAGENDHAAQLVALRRHVEIRHRGMTGVGLEERGEDPHGGGLAGPVGSEQADHAALRHDGVEAVDGADLAESFDEASATIAFAVRCDFGVVGAASSMTVSCIRCSFRGQAASADRHAGAVSRGSSGGAVSRHEVLRRQ